ncbi:hypothetical protein [Helicobacter felis]|uniref:hypothetical protein n=1 Tax=Helicobacter felis TaxID=214 RepID=UPI001315A858|nr:hypothetical protein [Helicobacter felis]
MAMGLHQATTGAFLGITTLVAMAPLAGIAVTTGAVMAAGAAGGALVGAVSGNQMGKGI